MTNKVFIMVIKGSQALTMPVSFPDISTAEYAIEWYRRAPEFARCIFHIVVEG